MTTGAQVYRTNCVAPISPDADSLPSWISRIFRASACSALLLLSAPVLSQTAPDLESTSSFGIVSTTYTNTTPGTFIDGDICFSIGPAVDPTVTGDEETPCDPQKETDQNEARAELDAQSCTPIGAAVALNTIEIGGGPPGEFPPGCYSSTGAMSITTGESITLSGEGVYIFRPGGALDPAANSSVLLDDGACSDNVFWTPIGATTIGANASFVGTIFRGTAEGLSITLGDSASLEGRALAFGSTVTTDNNNIVVPDECPEPGTDPDPDPDPDPGTDPDTATSVPIFSQGGIVLIVLMIMLMAAAFLRHFDLNRR